MCKENQPKVEIKTDKIEVISDLSSKGIQTNPQASFKNVVTPPKIAKVMKFGFFGKSLHFLGGMGFAFVCLYFHFMNYMKKSDENLKYEIEELKKIIQRRNLLEGTVPGEKVVVTEETQTICEDGKTHTKVEIQETKVTDNKNDRI